MMVLAGAGFDVFTSKLDAIAQHPH